MNLSLLGAFLGGVLTLLSPCSVMVLPAFFAYAFTSPKALLARTGVFFLGLVAALVPLGLLAGSLGAWVNRFRFEIVSVAAIVVIVFGLAIALGVRFPTLMRQRGASSATSASVFALGAVYGLSGVCAGPMLGAALTFAAFGGDPLFGGLVLLVFAVGMTVPLLILALVWNRIPAVQRMVRPRELIVGRWRNTWTNIVGGLLMVAIGVLLLVTDGTSSLGGILGATQQARLEGSVMQATAAVPNWVVMTALVMIAAVWLLVALKRRRAGSRVGAD